MRIFIKNKKFLSVFILSIFLFLSLSIFWGEAASDDCKSNCEKCTQAECGEDEIKAVCTWEPTLTTPTCCDKLEIGWPKSPMGTSLSGCSTLPAMIKYIYEWGIVLGGLAAFIALLMAGFQYLTSVGNPTKMKEAQNQIISAILGLILLLGSWLVLNTINPALTIFHEITFNPEAMGDVEGGFGDENATSCAFALFYAQPTYQGDSDIVPSRECNPPFPLGDGKCWAEYKTDGEYRSARCFVLCEPCESCTNEEVEYESSTIPIVADRKCQDPDGDDVYYNEEECKDPEGDGIYHETKCEQVLTSFVGDDECQLFDCTAYYKEGGSCTIQLFGDPDWLHFLDTCGEKISETYAKHPDFKRITDQTIDCFKLIKHIPEEY